MINLSILETVWRGLPEAMRNMIKDFVRYPTKSNEVYAIGYIKAARDYSAITTAEYDYLLSLLGAVCHSATVHRALRQLWSSEYDSHI